VQAKNPHAGDTNREGARVAGLQAQGKPHYPRRLQQAFAGVRVPETKFAPLVPEMLNVEPHAGHRAGWEWPTRRRLRLAVAIWMIVTQLCPANARCLF
jgi:hypothetical protein